MLAAVDDWPQFRGNPQLTGVTASVIAPNLKLLWSYEAGESIESSAAIANGTGVPFTDGPIAAAASTALIDALHARQGTFQTTANGGKTLAELLLKAAQAHDQGD